MTLLERIAKAKAEQRGEIRVTARTEAKPEWVRLHVSQPTFDSPRRAVKELSRG